MFEGEPIKGNIDQVEFSRLSGQSVTKGNIVLGKTNENNYVVHRIEKVEGEVVMFRGDGPLLRGFYLEISRSMKKMFYLFIVVASLVACSGPKGMVKIEPPQEDSVEYELIVFDSEFETWYMLQNSSARYRSQEYYEGWNRQYVSEWNCLATQPRRRSFFGSIIEYESGVDYGFELNHKLFYYFQYVEHVLCIPILSNNPSGVTY